MLFIIICVVLITLSFYIGYKYGRTVEKIKNNLKEVHQETDDLFIKDEKCEHEWKVFSSGYKQCKKCRSIVKNN
jgi:hypothetical protein